MIMAKIYVFGNTREVDSPVKENMKWGHWTIRIEGGFGEDPEKPLAEALRRVKGLIANTKDAENIKMYGGAFDGNLPC
jgi:hypothetical protein